MAWRAQGLSLRALRRLWPRGPGGHVAAAAAVTSTWGSVVPARGNCSPPRAGKAKQSFFTNVVRPTEKKGLFNANDVSPQRPGGREQQQQKYQQQRQQEEQQWTTNDQQKQQYQRSMVEAPDQPLSPADWAALKKQANNPRFESIVIEKLIETHGDLDIAKSLLNFVALESGDVSYGMLLPYLRLCVANQNGSEFLDVYKIMRDRYSILENTAYTFAIRGLCMTERWRESLALLEEMNTLLHPTAVNYTDIVKAALARCDVELAFRLYAEMLQKDLLPQDSMLQAFFELRGELAETNREKLEGILQYLRHSQTFPSEKLARSIGGWFESFKTEKWKARYIHILPQFVVLSLPIKTNRPKFPHSYQILEASNVEPHYLMGYHGCLPGVTCVRLGGVQAMFVQESDTFNVLSLSGLKLCHSCGVLSVLPLLCMSFLWVLWVSFHLSKHSHRPNFPMQDYPEKVLRKVKHVLFFIIMVFITLMCMSIII